MDIEVQSFVGQIPYWQPSSNSAKLGRLRCSACTVFPKFTLLLISCLCVICSLKNKVKSPSPKRNKCWRFVWRLSFSRCVQLTFTCLRNSKCSFRLCSVEQAVKSLECQVCVAFTCVSAFWSTECPLHLRQVSLGACAKDGCGGICVSVLFTSWLKRLRLEWRCNVCTLLSSLYSNDRPCCFTCRGGRSVALSLQPSL